MSEAATKTLPSLVPQDPGRPPDTSTVSANTVSPEAAALYVDRPLRGPNRTRPLEEIEEEADIQMIKDRANDPAIPWDEAKNRLGL